ncbi:MAG: cysteine hydrolase [Rhodobacterales bacterium]|nr:cysteine hydrolase [Rhodobacterales bacterium]
MPGLIVIDVQRGFITPDTRHVPDLVTRLQHRFDAVWVSRFVNPPGSAHRRLLGWARFAPGSDETALAFRPRAGARLADKTTYTCDGPPLRAWLAAHGLDTVYLAGIATDGCVLKTAVDLFEGGLRPVVLAGACASHGGADCHAAGLLLLKRFVGAGQVILDDPLVCPITD